MRYRFPSLPFNLADRPPMSIRKGKRTSEIFSNSKSGVNHTKIN